MKKLTCILLAMLMVFSLVSTAAFAEWPEKAITMVIPASPGGDTDTTSRALCESLSQVLGVPVTVSNVTGGAGIVAWNEVQNAKADGYTVLYHHVDTVLHNLLGRLDEDWDSDIDVAAVCGGGNGSVIVTSAKSQFQTFDDVIAYAKDHPGEVSFAMETGGVVHMHIYAIEDEAGVDFNEVDLGSSSTRNTALLGGQVDVIEAAYGQMEDYIKTGDVRVLCLLSEERNEAFPDVPAISEFGLHVYNDWWYYAGFKTGTDPEIVDKFAEAIKEAAYMDPYTNALGLYYYEPNVLVGEEGVARMKETQEFYRPVAEKMLAAIG